MEIGFMNGTENLQYSGKQKIYIMIISFKHKFIFIKTYKTAGSSIESYLYQFLNPNDIYAHTADNNGINCWGEFDPENKLSKFFDVDTYNERISKKLRFYAHMPIWLIKDRLDIWSNKLKFDIFENFYKFGVIRNPFDLVVSDFFWRKNSKLIKEKSFNEIIQELKDNKYQTYGLLNLNKLMDKKQENILCDYIVKYENLNEELSKIFNKLKIPFNGKLDIFKKRFDRERNYQKFYNESSRKLVESIFYKEIDMFKYKF